MPSKKLEKQLDYIRKITDFTPEIAIILGSGLGNLANKIDAKCSIDYADIPDFPVSTSPLHKGKLILGTLAGKKVAVGQGRVHIYEGYTPEQTVNPIRLIRKLGADKLLLTNAAGGINSDLSVGDFMILTDHISDFVPSPLIGENDESLGVRFPDMSEVYSKRLNEIIRRTASLNSINIKSGTYIQFCGPNFETPAEIRMAKLLGADAVGMSTATEAMAAVHCGFEVSAISFISNLACGISKSPLSDEEVAENAKKAESAFKTLIINAVKEF